MRSPDLDGIGRWTQDAIRNRYQQYCRLFDIKPRALPPGDDWLSQRGFVASLLGAMIEGMKEGDLACAEIGIELIEEDGGFAFDRILKANTARALGHCALTDPQKERIRTRVIDMLARGFMPHEFRDYARLLRRIGVGMHRERLERVADRTDPWV